MTRVASAFEPGALRLAPSDYSDAATFLGAQATAIRRWIIAMAAHTHTGHVGSSFSAVDVLTALYFHALRIDPRRPRWDERDRFILSKGHAAAAAYATLAARGFIDVEDLWSYLEDDSPLMAHISTRVPGIELATGSLGHGLPVGVGLAMAARHAAARWRTFVLLSDGECQEGSTWEASLSASHLELDNLVVLVDQNDMQALGRVSEVLPLAPLAAKFQSFGCAALEVDGHDLPALIATLDRLPLERGKPTVLLAQTVMGKGVSFMEGRMEWHYLAPTSDQALQALQELR